MSQLTLFDFDYNVDDVSIGATWLIGFDGECKTFRSDAEAVVEDLNSFPSGKGIWIRCLKIDHDAPYSKDQEDYVARIWQQKGLPITKMVCRDGGVKDFLQIGSDDDRKRSKPVDRPLEDAWIEDDTIHLKTSKGEYLAHIIQDSECHRYDIHPYNPSKDLEHFAIECYRNKVPETMMRWRERYVYGTPALEPFSRCIDIDEARRIDPMGQIEGGIEPNPMYRQICECADMIGIRLDLSHKVPEMQNLSMWYNEMDCGSCLHHRSPNKKDEPCWKGRPVHCFQYMWDRVKAAGSRSARHVDSEE